MSAPLSIRFTFDLDRADAMILSVVDTIRAASEFEALAEVRERLLGLGDAADKLFCVDVEDVAGPAGELRAFLKLSDAGRDLMAALGAGNVDRLVVEKALGHLIRSCGLQPGVDAESGPGETSAPAEHDVAPRSSTLRDLPTRRGGAA
jgi:hypothetical protein